MMKMNISINNPEFEPVDDIIVVSAWSIMGIYGLLTNLIILAGILSNRKMKQSTSYWLIISLSICDMSMISVCFCHLLPAATMHEQFMPVTNSFENALGIFFYNIFWYSGVLHLLIMALNRYVNICEPKYYLKLFSRQRTLFVITAAYLAGVSISFPGLFACCQMVFDNRHYVVVYSRPNTLYAYADIAVNCLSMLVMLYCYSRIVYKVRKSRIMVQRYRRLCRESVKRHQQAKYGRRDSRFVRLLRRGPQFPVVSRREVRLFFQFATVSTVFLLSFAAWQWLPRFNFASNSKWTGFVVTSLFFVNNAINPTVYLIFNHSLRIEIQRMLCTFRPTNDQHNSWMAVENAMTGYPRSRTLGSRRKRLDVECASEVNLYAITAVLNVNIAASVGVLGAVEESGNECQGSSTDSANQVQHTKSSALSHSPRQDFYTENVNNDCDVTVYCTDTQAAYNHNNSCSESTSSQNAELQELITPKAVRSRTTKQNLEFQTSEGSENSALIFEVETESVHL